MEISSRCGEKALTAWQRSLLPSEVASLPCELPPTGGEMASLACEIASPRGEMLPLA
jgi:hypothetical protein